jgi:hypothetical protein
VAIEIASVIVVDRMTVMPPTEQNLVIGVVLVASIKTIALVEGRHA